VIRHSFLQKSVMRTRKSERVGARRGSRIFHQKNICDRVPDRQHNSNILPMHTPCPAAGAAFACREILAEYADSAISRLELFCR
jgi:hypothetical protein